MRRHRREDQPEPEPEPEHRWLPGPVINYLGDPDAPAHPPGCDAGDELEEGHGEQVEPVPDTDGLGRPFAGPDEPVP
jgi:hypothetical protein